MIWSALNIDVFVFSSSFIDYFCPKKPLPSKCGPKGERRCRHYPLPPRSLVTNHSVSLVRATAVGKNVISSGLCNGGPYIWAIQLYWPYIWYIGNHRTQHINTCVLYMYMLSSVSAECNMLRSFSNACIVLLTSLFCTFSASERKVGLTSRGEGSVVMLCMSWLIDHWPRILGRTRICFIRAISDGPSFLSTFPNVSQFVLPTSSSPTRPHHPQGGGGCLTAKPDWCSCLRHSLAHYYS